MKITISTLLRKISFVCLLGVGLIVLTCVNVYAAGKSDIQSYKNVKRVTFDPDDSLKYCNQPVCTYTAATDRLIFEFSFTDGIPISDDENVYLFEISTYEDDMHLEEEKPVAVAFKHTNTTLCLPYRQRYLFSKFVPALLYEGDYVPISYGQYISNPEAFAYNRQDQLNLDSKKGILLDPTTIGSEKLDDLNVKRVVFNMPISYILGESDVPDELPTITYSYNGRNYKFNTYMLAGFDSLFQYLTENGYHTTLIILNDYNKEYPQMMHPLSRKKTSKSEYYAFNTEEAEGVRMMEAVALFLAQRYSGGQYGMIYDWVIANEINQQKIWNYMATDDLDYYTESFEKSFRTFYNAIKSCYSNARVYFSLDHDWNDNDGINSSFFNGRDLLYKFNEIAKRGGNYNWALSIHPYPNPLTKVRFWKGTYDKTKTTGIITPMNLSALVDTMLEDDLRDVNGNVRQIGVTELGFTSRTSESLQAAAVAYCYYIIEDNVYINSFLMNRQTDDEDALKTGLSLGIYNKDYSKKLVAEVFGNMDRAEGEDYIEEMLEIIGADSLEEALEWAR